MKYIDIGSLQQRLPNLRTDFQSKQPFRYVVLEEFFGPDAATLIHDTYPVIENEQWDGTTYIDQKNKFQKTTFDTGSVFTNVFRELNSPEFLGWLESVTDIRDIRADDELFGGGLHQSIAGAFLNVHVDYNFHPKTKFHRRLNVLVYMNKDWMDEHEGHLELWDFSDGKRTLLAKVRRCLTAA